MHGSHKPKTVQSIEKEMRIQLILKHLQLSSLFLFLGLLLVHQMFDGICHMIHAAGKPGEFILMLVLNTHR